MYCKVDAWFLQIKFSLTYTVSIWIASYLIFIYFTALQFCFALLLEGYNYQGNEYIYKEEWEHYEVNYVENGHFYSKILDRTSVVVRCCHGILKDSEKFETL